MKGVNQCVAISHGVVVKLLALKTKGRSFKIPGSLLHICKKMMIYNANVDLVNDSVYLKFSLNFYFILVL